MGRVLSVLSGNVPSPLQKMGVLFFQTGPPPFTDKTDKTHFVSFVRSYVAPFQKRMVARPRKNCWNHVHRDGRRTKGAIASQFPIHPKASEILKKKEGAKVTLRFTNRGWRADCRESRNELCISTRKAVDANIFYL